MPLIRKYVLFGPPTLRESARITDILRRETVGGVLMLLAAVAALLWANIDDASYEGVRSLALGPLDVQHWAADGLLAIFFLVAGLELKRELTVGSLSRPADALVPIVAAVCGMAVPALICLGINLVGEGGRPEAWAVPMATDIAFALAILAVVGRRLPSSLRVFLLTLAIVDDLGAIVIIATVYSHGLKVWWLLAALGCIGLWLLLQWRQASGWWLYLPLGLLCWWCTLNSGVHATIAGVALGLASRASATDATAPAERWEHLWRPVSAALAVPLFALLAAGVRLTPALLAGLVTQPLMIGIVAGLVVGKVVGVFGGAYLTARFTRAELASDLRWSEVFSASLLAGVGFTVSLLIAELGFAGDLAAADQARTAVLVGSLLAALLASISLRRRTASRLRHAAPGTAV